MKPSVSFFRKGIYMIQGRIHSLESFGGSDGPGIRYIIFLNGCSLRCRYCHNPDTWAKNNVQLFTADALLDKVENYREYWGEEGGITVSGGEPLLQIDFLLELFREAKKRGIHTCIDTSAAPFTREEPWFSKFVELMKVTDLLLLDIKHIDSEKHVWLTGKGNENILDAARFLSEIGKPVWIRHVLVPGVNSDRESLEKTAEFIGSLKNVERVDVLPYHTLGVFKWEELGIPYGLEGTPTPTDEELALAREILSIRKEA